MGLVVMDLVSILDGLTLGVMAALLVGVICLVLGIVCLVLLLQIKKSLRTQTAREQRDAAAPAGPAPGVSAAAPPAPAAIPNRGELVAAMSAALAEELGTDVPAIRIHSIRPVGGAAPVAVPNRGELVAAVSAALAEELGTDVSAIRIHALRRVS